MDITSPAHLLVFRPLIQIPVEGARASQGYSPTLQYRAKRIPKSRSLNKATLDEVFDYQPYLQHVDSSFQRIGLL